MKRMAALGAAAATAHTRIAFGSAILTPKRLERPSLQIEVSQIIIDRAHQPDIIVD